MKPSPEIIEFRKFFDHLGKSYAPAERINITEESIGNVDCYWFDHPEVKRDRIILYFHGGSYAAGSIASHKSLVSNLVNDVKISAVFIDYALAPEHPYPSGVNDAWYVYKAIVKQYPSSEIVFIGDSAGGGLILSLLGELQKASIVHPKAIVMMSPWLDLTCNNPSFTSNAKRDPILKQADLKNFAALYVRKTIQANPASLILHSVPPTLLLVGENEVLLDDSREFYARINTHQPKSKLKIFKEVNHVWLLTDITSLVAIETLTEIRTFINGI